MSEYQYYEFLAVDRPLDEADLRLSDRLDFLTHVHKLARVHRLRKRGGRSRLSAATQSIASAMPGGF